MRGNGLISTNNNNIMVEFKASPLEKELITTDRRELKELVNRKRKEKFQRSCFTSELRPDYVSFTHFPVNTH